MCNLPLNKQWSQIPSLSPPQNRHKYIYHYSSNTPPELINTPQWGCVLMKWIWYLNRCRSAYWDWSMLWVRRVTRARRRRVHSVGASIDLWPCTTTLNDPYLGEEHVWASLPSPSHVNSEGRFATLTRSIKSHDHKKLDPCSLFKR